MTEYNVKWLAHLLVEAWESAGLPADGITVSISNDGTIAWSALATQQHMDIAATVITNYTPPTVDPDENNSEIAERKARRYLRNIDFDARRTAIESITTLAGAKAALRVTNKTLAAVVVLLLKIDQQLPEE